MLFWLLVVVYVVGVALRTPFSLRNRMLAMYCTRCKSSRFFCNRRWHEKDGHHAVRGSIRERDGVDVAVAFTLASLWPTWIPFLAFCHISREVGQLVKHLVFHFTPLTEPELNRRIEQQRKEIASLQEKIDVPVETEVRLSNLSGRIEKSHLYGLGFRWSDLE